MRLTASGIALARACGYSFREDVELASEKTDEAKRGDAFGALAEAYINGTVPGEVKLSTEESDRLTAMWGAAQAWLEKNRRLGWMAEVAFAWDPTTDMARQLQREAHGHRKYREMGAALTEVCGTADIVSRDEDTVTVWDWKTHAPGAPETDATDQLEALALFAARAWGYDSARIVTLNVTAERGVEVVEGEALDMFALAEVAERLRGLIAGIPAAEAQPGAHCSERYCKAVSACPATTTALAQLVPDTALVRKGWAYQPVIESPDHLAHILTIRPALRRALDQVDAAVDAYVAAGPVMTSDGRTIKATFRTMPRMNQKDLVELAKRKGASDDEIGACIRSSVEGNGVRISGGKRGRAA